MSLYQTDRWIIKALVAWVFFLTTFNSVLNWLSFVYYFVQGITQPEHWGVAWWSLSVGEAVKPTGLSPRSPAQYQSSQ